VAAVTFLQGVLLFGLLAGLVVFMGVVGAVSGTEMVRPGAGRLASSRLATAVRPSIVVRLLRALVLLAELLVLLSLQITTCSLGHWMFGWEGSGLWIAVAWMLVGIVAVPIVATVAVCGVVSGVFPSRTVRTCLACVWSACFAALAVPALIDDDLLLALVTAVAILASLGLTITLIRVVPVSPFRVRRAQP
jgi:hypothetical protein